MNIHICLIKYKKIYMHLYIYIYTHRKITNKKYKHCKRLKIDIYKHNLQEKDIQSRKITNLYKSLTLQMIQAQESTNLFKKMN